MALSEQASNKQLPPTLVRTNSPGPLHGDFVRQQVAKQQRSNYHSSSLKTMNVNQTNLHPGGVA